MATGSRPRGYVVYRGRSVRVNFELDRGGIQRLALGPELQAACHTLVENTALPYAVGISPFSNQTDHQHYIMSFRVDDVVTGVTPEAIGKPPMLRVGTRLVNDAEHAAAVEWGTETHPRGHHVLRRTIDHLNTLGRDQN